jgi:D-3-phosphoglycerate dehydrogenase
MKAGRNSNLLTCFPVTDEQLARIQAVLPGWQVFRADQHDVAEQIHDCDVFCGHARHQQIDWTSVVQAGRLQWIQSSAAGLDHCLTPAVRQSPIVVSGCSGLFRDAVAEQTLALLFALVRRLPVFFRAQLERDFTRRPTDCLHGKTIGIAGFGGNGQRIAELLAPLGNRILATERFIDQWQAATTLPPVHRLLSADQLDVLLAASDVLILTLPLDESTRGIVGERELALMPAGSYLINVGRGGLVDEQAMLDSLRNGHLKAAGLDVTATEPLPFGSPLWTEPGVLLTPHVGAQSADRYERVVELLIENLGRFLRGERLKNLVDKQLGYPMPADRS